MAEQGRYTYTLRVDAKQYRRELNDASKLASKLSKDVVAGTKQQRAALKSASQEVDRTHRRYKILADAVKNFPNIADRTKDAQFFKELQGEAKNAKESLKAVEKQVNKSAQALTRLSQISAKQFRFTQVASDPKKAEADLAAQNRRTKQRILLLNKVSTKLRESREEQRALNKAGLDTAAVDLRVARLTATHVKLNGALSRGVDNAKRLEKELKDVANIQSRLGSTQYSKPIGPAAPKRGFRGNTGRRAGVGKALSGGGGGAGMLGAALTGGIAGIAAAAAGKLLQQLEDLARATAQYANDAAVAAAETQKMRRALAGVLGSEAPAAFESIKKVVSDFNVPLQDATKGFTRFAASAKSSGVSSKDIEKSFRGLIAANKALGGSQEQANGIILAATQVFGKGKVAAEELRGQIAERLPGSVALFAESMGLTTAELDKRLEQGTVSVADFVKFTGDLLRDFEEDAKGIAKGPEEAGQRLAVQLDLLQRNIGMMLAPIGAAFQTTFAIIVGAINAGIEALNRFLGLTPEAAVEKAQKTLEARQKGLTNAIKGKGRLVNVGQQGSARRETEAEARAALDDAIGELAKARKLLGTGTGSIEKGKLVTAEDLINNRKGTGGSGGSGADLNNIAAANARRLAEESARQVMALDKQRFALLKRLRGEDHRLAEANLTGTQRAQRAITNAYIAQNEAISDQVRELDAAVSKAQANLDAAKTQLEAASSGANQLRAQGLVDIAGERLAGATAQRAQFGSKVPQLRDNAASTAALAGTEGFRNTAANAQDELQRLRERNRLMLEGFSPTQIEAQMQLMDIERERIGLLGELTPQLAGYNTQMAQINETSQAAKDAVTELTAAQEANASGMAEYINSNLQFVGDLQARMVDMASTIEGSLSNAIESVISGTATIGEAFKNFFSDIGKAFIQMASQMIAKLIMISLLKAALGVDPGTSLGGGGGSSGGLMGFLSGLFGGGEKKMAKGGIVTRPTRALIGEGGMNEAVVPLPDGKSIPIDMGKKGMGSNVNTNITVNVDQGGNADTQTSGDNANKLGKAIDSAVKRVIMDERRSGGLLYSGRR